jgi:hypothetical protein
LDQGSDVEPFNVLLQKQQNPAGESVRPNLSNHEIELRLRHALQRCSATGGYSEACSKLVELLQLPELLGAHFMKDFPVSYPDESIGGSVGPESALKWEQAPCAVEAPLEREYRC